MHAVFIRRAAGIPGEAGFTLIEVLVATGLLSVAAASLVQLFALATHANIGARATTYGTLLAAQKVEELRAGAFPDDAPLQGEDAVDAYGRPVDAGFVAPAYRRRWTIDPWAAYPSRAVVVSVVVSPAAGDELRSVRVTTIRTRTP